jgi:hypothetical protein
MELQWRTPQQRCWDGASTSPLTGACSSIQGTSHMCNGPTNTCTSSLQTHRNTSFHTIHPNVLTHIGKTRNPSPHTTLHISPKNVTTLPYCFLLSAWKDCPPIIAPTWKSPPRPPIPSLFLAAEVRRRRTSCASTNITSKILSFLIQTDQIFLAFRPLAIRPLISADWVIFFAFFGRKVAHSGVGVGVCNGCSEVLCWVRVRFILWLFNCPEMEYFVKMEATSIGFIAVCFFFTALRYWTLLNHKVLSI